MSPAQKVTLSFSKACAPLAMLFLPLSASAQIVYTLESHIIPEKVEDLLIAILEILIVLAIPIVVFFIIYAGFLYVTAQGNVDQIKKASRSLTYAVIGALMIIGAIALSAVIRDLVESFTK